jgi:pimeloyl-ACP methyl ester carboxylesterase
LSDVDLMLESGAAGDALLEACAKDEECSARLGDDPLGKALEILDGGGDCEGLVAAGFDRVRTQYLLVETLIDNETRGLVPPLLYRLERCEDEDVAFILALWDHLANRPGPAEGDPFGHSFALLPLIHGSEIYTVPTTDQQVWDIGRTALFANVGYVLSSYQGWALWPRYPTDRWVGQWAETDANVLVLHGTFDATTPIQDAQELAAHFSGKHQYYFEIEHASHGAAYTSHEVADGLTCGTYILDQFLDDPTTRPEGDCASAAPPYEFTAKDELLTELLGHTDVWDNPPK